VIQFLAYSSAVRCGALAQAFDQLRVAPDAEVDVIAALAGFPLFSHGTILMLYKCLSSVFDFICPQARTSQPERLR
jgi:hypothetical protein